MRMYSSIIIAALSAVAFWIVVDSASKLYIKKLGKELASVAVLAAGIIPMLLLFIAYGTFNLSNVPLLLAAGVAGGAALFLGYLFVYKSVPEGGVANSYMLVEVQPPLLILFGIFALGEHLSALQLASMIVIFAGVSLIVFTKELRLDWRLAPALAGNVMWAAYWLIVVLAVLHYKNFVAPLLLVRIFGALFAYAYYKYAKSKHAAHTAP
ncbi:MAG: EamA family transporter, partial [Candidatus Micrarchaeaceae archaeon]